MAGTTSYYHCDASGNVRALTDSNQNVTDRYTYDAFGNTVAQSGTTENNFRFGGQVGYHLNPDTGAYYVRARVYQPTIIRWLSVDPLGFDEDDLNLFRYIRNRPSTFIDPSGNAIVLCQLDYKHLGGVYWDIANYTPPAKPEQACKQKFKTAWTGKSAPIPTFEFPDPEMIQSAPCCDQGECINECQRVWQVLIDFCPKACNPFRSDKGRKNKTCITKCQEYIFGDLFKCRNRCRGCIEGFNPPIPPGTVIA